MSYYSTRFTILLPLLLWCLSLLVYNVINVKSYYMPDIRHIHNLKNRNGHKCHFSHLFALNSEKQFPILSDKISKISKTVKTTETKSLKNEKNTEKNDKKKLELVDGLKVKKIR